MKNHVQQGAAWIGLLTGGMSVAAPLPVAASTSVIADFVRAVGGTRVSVVTVVPANADTHTYQPATGDVKKLSQARVLFVNGANLEPWLPRLQGAVQSVPVVTLSRSITLRAASELQKEGLSAEGAFDPHGVVESIERRRVCEEHPGHPGRASIRQGRQRIPRTRARIPGSCWHWTGTPKRSLPPSPPPSASSSPTTTRSAIWRPAMA